MIKSVNVERRVANKGNVSDDLSAARVARASQDELSTLSKELAVAARLITAISLQNGLVDGTISPDAVTAELLNIGTAELALLKGFNREKVDGFVQKLKAITLDDDVEEIENTILLMNEWKLRYARMGRLEDTSSADAFFATVANAKLVDSELLGNLTVSVNRVRQGLQHLPGVSSAPRMLSILRDLRQYCGMLGDGLARIPEVVDQMRHLKLLTGSKFTVDSPQAVFVDLFDDFNTNYPQLKRGDPGEYETLFQLIVNVFSLTPDAKASEGELKVVDAVAESRGQFHERRFTSGFLNGYSDIGKLAVDARNVKFQKLVPGIKANVLKAGLSPLQSLMIYASDVEKEWSGMSSELLQATEDVRKISRKLIAFERLPDKAALLNISVCSHKPMLYPRSYSDIDTVVMNARMLPANIDALLPLVEQLSTSPLAGNASEFAKLKDVIQFASEDPGAMTTQAPTIKAEVLKFPIDGMIETLEKARPQLEHLVAAMKPVRSIIQTFPDIKTIIASLLAEPETAKFEKYFTCMNATHADSVASAVALIQMLRNVGKISGAIGNTNKLIAIIDDSRDAVGSLQMESAGIHEHPEPEVKELAGLAPLGTESKRFGDSVTAVTNVRNALKKRAQLEKVLSDEPRMAMAIQKVRRLKTRNTLTAAWRDIQKAKGELSSLLADLQAKRDKMVVPKAARFADYGPVFSGFNGMVDADLKVFERLKILESLIPMSPELTSLKTSLEELKGLDLQFSRFNSPLSGMSATLANVDGFFATFISHSLNATTDSGFPVVMTIIIAAIVAVILIACVLLFVFRKQLKDKLSKPKKPSSSNNQKDQKAQIHPIPTGFDMNNTKMTTTGMTGGISAISAMPTISTTAPITEDSKTKGVEKDGDDPLHKSTVANSWINSDSASSFGFAAVKQSNEQKDAKLRSNYSPERRPISFTQSTPNSVDWNTVALVQNALSSLAVKEDTRGPYRQVDSREFPMINTTRKEEFKHVLSTLTIGRFVSIESFFQNICRFAEDWNTAALVQNALSSLAVKEDTRGPYRQVDSREFPMINTTRKEEFKHVLSTLTIGRFVSIESFFQNICRFAEDDNQLCFTSWEELHNAKDDWITGQHETVTTGDIHQIKEDDVQCATSLS